MTSLVDCDSIQLKSEQGGEIMRKKPEQPKEVRELQEMADALRRLTEPQFNLVRGVLIGMGVIEPRV